MSKSKITRGALAIAAAGSLLAAGWGITALAATGETGKEAARCDTYTAADGATYFALSLPPTAAPAATSHDMVILFDTSAGQGGAFRDKGLELLGSLLQTAGPSDRVLLMAVDLNAIPLCDGFVAPRGAEIDAAMNALRRRVPLGATDMSVALDKAASCFAGLAGHSDAGRSVIYIGDGSSKANVVVNDFENLTQRLAAAHVACSSYAIGKPIDATMLAALANQTGGMLLVDTDQMSGKDAGQHLLSMAEGAVIWPTETKVSKSVAEVLPKHTPPLRADRDTVLLGKLASVKPFDVQIKGEAAGKTISLTWTAEPRKSNSENSYVADLVGAGEANGGVRLPTLGSEGLWESRRLVHLGAQTLAKLGAQAAAHGNRQQADQLINEALRIDPDNAQASVMKGQLKNGTKVAMAEEPVPPPPGKGTPAAQGSGDSGDLQLVGPPSNAVGSQNDTGAGQFLKEYGTELQVRIEQFKAEVNQVLEAARQRVAIDPSGVMDMLRLKLAAVDSNPELPADVRARLRDQIQRMLQIADGDRRTLDFQREEVDKNVAFEKESERINKGLIRDQQKVDQLVERMNSLLADGRYEEAQTDAAAEINRVMPDNTPLATTIATSSGVNARFFSYYMEYSQVRDAKEKNILASLHLCDTSSIPFPDDPPVVYPSADRWRELTKDREKYKSVDLKEPGSAEAKILKALDSPTDLEFDGAALKDVVDALKLKHGIEIQLDEKALKEANIADDTPITANLKGITLRSALRLILSQYDLNYYIEHEVLLITTNDKAKDHLVTKVYPVADLVLPVAVPSNLNPFQSGGGLGGQSSMNGGMGGGAFGGGGMQGGGFGGGGFGGGGGGGGAFDVPAETPAAAPAGDAKAKPATKSDDKSNADRRPAKITLPGSDAAAPAAANGADKKSADKNVAGSDVETKWDNYFAKLDVPNLGTKEYWSNPKVCAAADEQLRKINVSVRETVGQLLKHRKFAETSALIRGALRHSWGQPWMYEVLGLSMQADNQPRSEIERALMSAADFARTNDDRMLVAAYMSRSGFDARALKLYQEAAQLEPQRFEPYMWGLKIAERIHDVDGIQWACAGALSQTWTPDKQAVVDDALRIAKSTIRDLRASKQGAKADSFEAAMARAELRDCLVKIIYTGDAEIDLSVEEPSGTVCSLRDPRTTSGGTLLDASSRPASMTDEGSTDEYVVTQGFSGTYRMLLRRVWGEVAAGKVTVDIYTHYGSKQVTRIHKQIPLGEKDALVIFDLKNGRRTESLDQAKVANAVQNVVGVNQAILAQIAAAPIGTPAAGNPALFNPNLNNQLQGINNAGALAALPAAQGVIPATGTGAGAGNGQGGAPFIPFIPFGLQGAVGYQPVITVLPTGTNLAATAVISADRRYVRIAAVPLFSSIGQVSTFNYTTGSTATTSSGSGGTIGTP